MNKKNTNKKEKRQKVVTKHFQWRTLIVFFVVGSVISWVLVVIFASFYIGPIVWATANTDSNKSTITDNEDNGVVDEDVFPRIPFTAQ